MCVALGGRLLASLFPGTRLGFSLLGQGSESRDRDSGIQRLWG